MPKLRAAMHLDTVFTFADRDVITIYPEIVDSIASFTLVPGDSDVGIDVIEETKPFVEVVAAALDLPELRVVETGGPSTTTSASNGTAATTSSPSNPEWYSLMTETRTPIPCCARPGWRSSPSSGRNWVAAAVEGTA